MTPLRREELALAVTGGQLSQTQAARVYGRLTQDRVALDRTVQNGRTRGYGGSFTASQDQSPADGRRFNVRTTPDWRPLRRRALYSSGRPTCGRFSLSRTQHWQSLRCRQLASAGGSPYRIREMSTEEVERRVAHAVLLQIKQKEDNSILVDFQIPAKTLPKQPERRRTPFLAFSVPGKRKVSLKADGKNCSFSIPSDSRTGCRRPRIEKYFNYFGLKEVFSLNLFALCQGGPSSISITSSQQPPDRFSVFKEN